MITIIGSGQDKVIPRLNACIDKRGIRRVFINEDKPTEFRIRQKETASGTTFHIWQRNFCSETAVTAVFIRHAVARTLDPAFLIELRKFQYALNQMLLAARTTIVNPPHRSQSNYSKPHQVHLLRRAGFDVPKTLVTNVPEQAKEFYEECGGRVIFKGVSNVVTLAQLLDEKNIGRLDLLPNSPTLFQEYVEGADYRVHVIGAEAMVTKLTAEDPDYRRAALSSSQDVSVEPGRLPEPVLERCIAVTRDLGLRVSGIDFKESADGRIVALELNPYPQFTFYEQRSGQPLTSKVVDLLVQEGTSTSNVFV